MSRKWLTWPIVGLLLGLFAAVSLYGEAQQFEFRYRDGERYRILSTVDQEVRINGRLSHQARILNRIAIEVTAVDGDRGTIEATFRTSEEAFRAGQVFAWGEDYTSRFERDARGYYDIEPHYFMPVVRDVPVFPEHELAPGDTWTAEGSEVHDFRRGFGIPEAFHFPITVHYRYAGREERDGKKLDVIEMRYNVLHRPEGVRTRQVYPHTITGYADQRLYWDNLAGRPHSYEEDYALVFALTDGRTFEFSGTAEARVVESDPLDRDALRTEIERDLEERGVEDTRVASDDDGVTISLENIQFAPDSDELLLSERAKLDAIAEILLRYPDRDIMVTGHTALAGTEAGRRQLSERRAQVVGQYLLDSGVRTTDQIMTRGFGAQRPVADNDTAEGRRRNRRVEITIMEH